MLNLILGGSGSGKTTLIEEKIKKDIESGRQVILLVPEQETVSAERRMLSLLPPSAQLSFEVLNFTRLANRVFRQCGDRKSTRLNSSHTQKSRMPSSA